MLRFCCSCVIIVCGVLGMQKRFFAVYRSYIIVFGRVRGAKRFLRSPIYYFVAPTHSQKVKIVRELERKGLEMVDVGEFLDRVAEQLIGKAPPVGALVIEALKKGGL